jgi:hypothetical protein
MSLDDTQPKRGSDPRKKLNIPIEFIHSCPIIFDMNNEYLSSNPGRGSLVHGLEKRVLSVQVIVLPSAHVHVSRRVGTILRREPVPVPVISSNFGHVVAQHHHVVAVQSRIFFAYSIVVFNRVQIAGMHALVFVPGLNMVGGVHGVVNNKKTAGPAFNFFLLV